MRHASIGAVVLVSLINITCSEQQRQPTTAPVETPAELTGDSMMKGTPEERDAAITQALKDDERRTQQMRTTDLDLKTTLQFLQIQTKVDIAVDWAGLERVGIDKDFKVEVNLYDKTFAEVLEVLMSMPHPTSGSVGYSIKKGVLVIGPQAKATVVDAKVEEKRNAAVRTALKQEMVADRIEGRNMSLGELLSLVQTQQKIVSVRRTPLHEFGRWAQGLLIGIG